MSKEINANASGKEKSLLNKLIYNWIFIPVGITLITGVVIMVNQIFKAISFNFPANVASMLLVSFVLILGDTILPEGMVQKAIKLLNPAINFLMDWMIIFFIPPLITIINSSSFPGSIDIVKLIIVFFIGLLIFIPLVGYSVHFMGILFDKLRKGNKTENIKNNNFPAMISIVIESENNEKEAYIYNFDDKISQNSDKTSYLRDKTTCYSINDEVSHNSDKTTCYSINDEISHNSDKTYENECDITATNKAEVIEIQDFKKLCSKDDRSMNTATTLTSSFEEDKEEKIPFSWKSTAIPSKHNIITYLILFTLSWIPAALWGIMQPLHISINVLAYFAGLCVPDKIRVILHPLISCTAVSYILLFIESLVFGRSFTEEIGLYSNGTKYLMYLNNPSLPFPRAGEILFCVLDATVVTLSFRIFEHYKLIIKHAFELVGTIIVMSFLSMVIHILLCRLAHITPIYALSMSTRSITTPLAVQVVDLLDSDMAIAVIIVVFTGVFTDIIGLPYLKFLRFPFKDSLAHGACMGCAGDAVATAGLIKKFPSASAVSSISFVLFSTFCVIWASIPAVTSIFYAIAGL